MLELVNTLFGAYVPITDSGGVALSGLAGVNWPWIAGVLLFAICLISLFKIIGVVIKK